MRDNLGKLISMKRLLLVALVATISHASAERTGDTSVLDVDASGDVEPLTDGLMILRAMFGFTDDALISGAVDLSNCLECDSSDIGQ